MKWSKVLGALLVLAIHQKAQAQATATVSWTTTYQTIDGFGASDHHAGTQVNQYDTLFFNTLGYSILRVGTTEDGSCTTVSYACAYNGGVTQNGGPGDLADMQACAAVSGCRVFVVPWTPPAIYKTNNDYTCTAGSGNATLMTSDYGQYATYLSNYITSLSQQGVPVYAISVQNEPTICYAGTSALWSGANIDTFVKNNLGPTLAANGQSGVKIVLPESNVYSSLTGDAGNCLGDSSCSTYVSTISFHDYDQPSSYPNPYPSKGYWQTEMWDGAGGQGAQNNSNCSNFCPGIADAMFWASLIDNALVNNNVNAWLYWWLVTGSTTYNNALVENGQVAIRAYVIGQYSKFIRPGWIRIGATHAPQSGVTVSAYKSASTGAFAIVATNQNTSDAEQTFSLSGFAATSVTPYTTSDSVSLAQQPTVTAGGSFSYALPAQSVTTFVGTISGSSPGGDVAPPTGLTLVIH